MDKSHNFHSLVEGESISQKNIIANQRTIYQAANLDSNYEVMMKCIDNIFSELAGSVKGKQQFSEIEKTIKETIEWFEKLPLENGRKTQNGFVVKYPLNIEVEITKKLRKAYKELIIILHTLGLL